jgi:hypothetical protein
MAESGTLRFAAVFRHLLTPCLPGYAAPAWVSRFAARAPPFRRSNQKGVSAT